MKKITISLVYKHLFINWVKVRHNVIHCTSKCVLDTIYIISTRAWSALQFSSVSQSCPTLCNPMRHSTPGLPVHHPLLEYTQTYIYWISDDIQPSHPLSSPSPPAFNLSKHQHLFKWVSSLHQVAKILEFQLQHHSFLRRLRTDLL